MCASNINPVSADIYGNFVVKNLFWWAKTTTATTKTQLIGFVYVSQAPLTSGKLMQIMVWGNFIGGLQIHAYSLEDTSRPSQSLLMPARERAQ